MIILSIESSCDDTSLAIIKGNPRTGCFEILAEKTESQVIHKKYGGVVPEVAAREHADHIALLLESVFKKAGIKKPDCVAVTAGPGLMTSLLVGVQTARALGMIWGIPVLPVNHIEGHIYSNWIGSHTSFPRKRESMPLSKIDSRLRRNDNVFPTLILIASGGHTELILMASHGKYKLLGKTLDDAAGECFDKIGKIMGFEYPGGPKISEAASLYTSAPHSPMPHSLPSLSRKRSLISKNKDSRLRWDDVTLPRPMINSGDYNFSFSGLKTAALYKLRDNPDVLKSKKKKIAFAHEVEEAIVDVLVSKTLRAAEKFQPHTVMIGGGVAANKKLVSKMVLAIKKLDSGFRQNDSSVTFIKPNPKYTTDNATMIAVAAFFNIQKNGTPKLENWKKIDANPNWRIAK